MIEIPLRNGVQNTHQRFSLRVGVNMLEFRVNYISYLDHPAWSLDVLRDGATLIAGVMLEPNAEISKGYRAGIGRLFFIGQEVTLDNLGVDNNLIWTEA